jgi:SAM-dependent methyltransferase
MNGQRSLASGLEAKAQRGGPETDRSAAARRRANWLSSPYAAVKAAYFREQGYRVPAIYSSAFVHWGGGAEVQFIFRQFLRQVPAGASVLIVGVLGGRDYFLCRNLGYRVTAVDLGPQPEIEPLLLCDVERGLPLGEETFDAVILSEIIEHLLSDGQFLGEVRRVLKPTGKLLISLPYYNDWEEGHVRIHSPWSAGRLLRVSGFRVEDYLERPGIGIWPGRLNILIHTLSMISYWLFGRTIYGAATEIAGRVEYRCGHLRALRRLRRLSRHFGGYYLCAKAEVLDHVALNKALYTQAAAAANGDELS